MPDSPSPSSNDPFQSLHKMSTTAGLGSGDYVAINGASVVAVLLGLAAFIAVLGDALLVIPLAGLICSIVSLVQIRRSNGTQTGRGFAAAGLILSLAAASFVVGRHWIDYSRNSADRKAIATLIETFETQVTSGKIDDSYALFSKRFKTKVDQKTYSARYQSMAANPDYGRITSFKWNKEVMFVEIASDPTSRFAQGMVIIVFEKNPGYPQRMILNLRRVAGDWSIDAFALMFPESVTSRDE